MKKHYNEIWNWVDSVILILAFAALFFWIKIISKHISNVAALEYPLVPNNEKAEVFTEIAYALLRYLNLTAINFVPIFFKLLKYLSSWFQRVKLIFRTLAWAQSDILYFLIMYMVIFFAFVVMCHIYYGADLINFSDIL